MCIRRQHIRYPIPDDGTSSTCRLVCPGMVRHRCHHNLYGHFCLRLKLKNFLLSVILSRNLRIHFGVLPKQVDEIFYVI